MPRIEVPYVNWSWLVKKLNSIARRIKYFIPPGKKFPLFASDKKAEKPFPKRSLKTLRGEGVEWNQSSQFLRVDHFLYSHYLPLILFLSSRYYNCDEDVANDFELQNFMNEVSADGEGSEGGMGNVSLSRY